MRLRAMTSVVVAARVLRARRVLACLGIVTFGAACGPAASSTPPSGPPPTATSLRVPRTSAEAASAPPAPAASLAPLDAAAIYAKLQPDLTACFVQGKKATPEMSDGKVTLHAAIDADGSAACVIPSDAEGLTQDVEDCMAARLAKERFAAAPARSIALPIAVHSSALAFGDPARDVARIDSIETTRMPDAFEMLESLVPELQGCLQGAESVAGLKSILVAARVGPDGRAQCALASSNGSLPQRIAECAAGVLRGARFPPPKRGSGIVVVPLVLAGAAKK